MSSNGLTLTILRTALISELEAKRDALVVDYDALIVEAEATLATEKASTTRWADWYQQIAEGIKEGKLGVKENGSLVLLEGREIPKKPTKNNVSYALHHLEYRLQDLKNNKDESVRTIESQLRLLALATDTEVQVQASDYQRLLEMSVVDRYKGRY